MANTKPPKKYYVGTGSGFTPAPILKIMTAGATFLEKKGFILRSGGNSTADAHWEQGVQDPKNKEIYLPWSRYNNSKSPYFLKTDELDLPTDDPGYEYAARLHPDWGRETRQAQHLHGRVAYELLGPKLDTKALMVVYCHNEDKGASGQTSVTIPLALELGIPVFNLWKEDVLAKFCKQCELTVPKGIVFTGP